MKNSRKLACRNNIWSSTACFLAVKQRSIRWRRRSVLANKRLLSDLPDALKDLPYDQVALKPFNLVGLDALRQLLTETISSEVAAISRRIQFRSDSLNDAPSLSALVDVIAADKHGLVMLMGKGGVGKTTLAAAVAVELARRGLPVHLTTSDPAANLSETLDGSMDNLAVSRIDPHAETERYRQHVLETKGANLDAEGRALLEEDLRSPCTEEIAVFQAFSRIIREAGQKFVVMDTAPTGHTLLLLDATGAYHREIMRQTTDKKLHVTNADDAAPGREANQDTVGDIGGNHAGTGGCQPASRFAPRRDRAVGMDYQ